jgi:hypothetical protein
MGDCMKEFACPDSCQYAGKEWPRHLPKPGCRIVAEYLATDNPVTLSVRRNIIRNRLGYQSQKSPPCVEEKK